MNDDYFDEYAKSYDKLLEEQLNSFGDVSYYAEYKVKLSTNYFDKKNIKILEYGCGIGKNFDFLKKHFPYADINGFDVSTESIRIAQEKYPSINIISENEFDLLKDTFDFIFVTNVYHHIPVKYRPEVTDNIYKLLKKNGKFICFEHNPFNPLTLHVVNNCEFDEDAILLKMKEMKKLALNSSFITVEGKYTLFFPPILKKLSFIEKYLTFLPLGAQYYTIATK